MPTFKPKGYKDLDAAQKLIDSAPKDSDFNPYDYIDQSYYKNNARGRMAYQEDLAKLLYMAQINQEERMNEYNSPEEQAKRMREAGLNPDLLGVSGEPAANVAGYQGNPMDGTQSTLQNVGDVVGIISNVTAIVTQLASGISGISTAGINNFATSLSSASSLFDLFDKSSLSDDGGTSDIFLSGLLPNLSHRQMKQIKKARTIYANSTRGITSSNRAKNESFVQRGDFNRMSLDPKFSDSVEEYTKAWQPLIDAMSEFAVKELKGKSARSDYDAEYYSSDKAVSDKSYESNSRDFEKSTQDWFRQFKTPIVEVMKNLDLIKNEEVRNLSKVALASVILKYLPL